MGYGCEKGEGYFLEKKGECFVWGKEGWEKGEELRMGKREGLRLGKGAGLRLGKRGGLRV